MKRERIKITLPQRAWYGDGMTEISFPVTWDVTTCTMPGHIEQGRKGVINREKSAITLHLMREEETNGEGKAEIDHWQGETYFTIY